MKVTVKMQTQRNDSILQGQFMKVVTERIHSQNSEFPMINADVAVTWADKSRWFVVNNLEGLYNDPTVTAQNITKQ
ncbi:hypothetical protein SUGI_0172470 [Cryptomeria japonica]|nr:hypothetical protein SUGI_0172470 [Cryptomeria japonica]